MKKNVMLALTLICLLTPNLAYIQPIKAQYQGNVIINSDGSVNPSIPSIQHSGNTYFLTTDIAGNITTQKSNIVLDGNGYKADSVAIGLDTTTGISNVTVKNFIIDGTSGEAYLSPRAPLNSFFSSFGIMVYNGSNVLVTNNTIINTRHPGVFVSTVGINIVGGTSNKVIGNNVENNSDGLSFSYTQNNIITENNVTANHGWGLEFSWGISFFNASNNLIFNNNFVNNDNYNYAGWQAGTIDSTTHPSIDRWDNGRVGNYWSDYNGTDANDDGIGDVPYKVNLNPQADNYPLMHLFDDAFYLLETTPPSISLMSPLNQTYIERNVTLLFSLDKPVSWIGYSLDGQPNVTVTNNGTLYDISNGAHSITVYANDTFGNMGSSTVSFDVPKPSSFPTLTVAVAAILVVVVVVFAGLLVYRRHRKA